MAQLKKMECQTCGGSLEKLDDTTYKCTSCRSKYQVDSSSQSDQISLALFSASSSRQRAKFDEALEEFEEILTNQPNNFDANWGAMLCEFGIIYSKMDDTAEPIMYFINKQSVFDNAFYQRAMQNCSFKNDYLDAAQKIENYRHKALSLIKECKTQVMICCQESKHGNPSKEHQAAILLEQQLKAKNINSFYSGINLKNLSYVDYEPYIYANLNTAKVLVVIASNKDACNIDYVRNTWRRFVKKKSDNNLVTLYFDCDAADLPSVLKKGNIIDIKCNAKSAVSIIADAISGSSNSQAIKETKTSQVENNQYNKESTQKNMRSSSASSQRDNVLEEVTTPHRTPRKTCSTSSSLHSKASQPKVSANNYNVSNGDGYSIQTNPEALRKISQQIKDYNRKQDQILTQCYMNLQHIMYDWDDGNMEQVINEIRSIQAQFNSKIAQSDYFANWLNEKANLLSSSKNYKI